MPNSPTEKSGKRQLNLNISVEIDKDFRALAKTENRNFNQQFEVVFKEWVELKSLLKESPMVRSLLEKKRAAPRPTAKIVLPPLPGSKRHTGTHD